MCVLIDLPVMWQPGLGGALSEGREVTVHCHETIGAFCNDMENVFFNIFKFHPEL